MRKINRTARAIVGTVQVFSAEGDNDVKIEVQLYKKQGGEYRKLPYNFPKAPLCDTINNDDHFYPDVVKHSDMPMPMPCPIPKVC
jgi:hypothetical protein